MKRSKVSSGETGRRARVETANTDTEAADPIAAAAHAKKAREGKGLNLQVWNDYHACHIA